METIIKEKIIPVWGTTKLCVGDPYYLINIKNGTDKGRMKDLVFDGSISAAKYGKMQIALRHYYYFDSDIEFDMITVTIVQGSVERMLDVYLEGKYFKDTLKEQKELGCDTACFEITTKFGFDNFHTGADGYYGTLCKYKQHYGMMLDLSFYADLFSFDEIEERMLKLFPKRN